MRAVKFRELAAEAVRGAGFAPGRGGDGQGAGAQHSAAAGGQRRDEGARCLSGWPFPALALVTAFGPSSTAAAAAPATAPRLADLPAVQVGRRECGPGLLCVNSMRVRFPRP